MPRKSAEFDYVLVGSGVAGLTLAKRLLEANPRTSILMLEAGPVIPAKNRRSWWDYITLKRTPYDFTYDQEWDAKSLGNINWITAGTRVKAYGGSTMHWGAWCLRFKPEDFRLRSNTGLGADWPFSYDDLEPYYCEAEEFLAVCGDDREKWTPRSKPYPLPPFAWTAADGVMIDAFEDLGIVPGKMPIARYRKCMATGTCKYCPFGARFSAQAVLDDLREDPRHTSFEVRTDSPAKRLLVGARNRIDGVEYVDNRTGETKIVRGGNYIVCSGAYETPKLLMVSKHAKHWKNGVGNDHDLLGRFIISHSMLKVRGSTPSNRERWFQEYDFPTLMSRSYDTPEEQKTGKLFLFKNRVLPNIDIAAMMIRGMTPEQIDLAVSGPMELEVQAFMEEKGRFENRLELMDGVDRFGLPRTKITFSRNAVEQENTRKQLALMSEIIKAMNYKIVYAQTEDPGAHHTTGTCRMATTPEEGVTDPNLRVHGIDNLYLCSNGVFPSGSAVNPTLTLTALAMRLSDHLLGRRPLPPTESSHVETHVPVA